MFWRICFLHFCSRRWGIKSGRKCLENELIFFLFDELYSNPHIGFRESAAVPKTCMCKVCKRSTFLSSTSMINCTLASCIEQSHRFLLFASKTKHTGMVWKVVIVNPRFGFVLKSIFVGFWHHMYYCTVVQKSPLDALFLLVHIKRLEKNGLSFVL